MSEQTQAKLNSKDNSYNQSILKKWQWLFIDELKGVDNVFKSLTSSQTKLIAEVISHILSSGGKRLRPILTILSGKLCGHEGQRHINLAAVIELIHTATLLHDDVVDESDLRRGEATANNIWNNASSVLVGDFLLSKAFQLIAEDSSVKVLNILSSASTIMTEGEIKQLMSANEIHTNQDAYLEIITSKTAELFAAACSIGAVISERPEAEEKALAGFGLNLGIAFQIVDDILDYSAVQEKLGKTIGDDFREGKVTLPVILAYKRGSDIEKKFWENAINGKNQDLDKAISLINQHNAIDDCHKLAREYSLKAKEYLNIFPDCDEKSVMLDLLEFSLNRPY